MHYKYGLIYREVAKVTDIDVCKLADGLTKEMNTNLLVKFFYDLVNNSAPGLIQPCPYYVTFSNFNINISEGKYFYCLQGLNLRNCNVKTNDFPSIMPAGEYRLILCVTQNDEFVSTANVMVTMISPLKENFGRK